MILDTYRRAKAAGDEHVCFVHGMGMLPENWQDCSVDRLHPNDLGFRHMPDAIGAAVRKPQFHVCPQTDSHR